MRTTDTTAGHGLTRRLADPAAAGAYVFAEHTVEPGRAAVFRAPPGGRTVVVVAGRVLRDAPGGGAYGRWQGWHVAPGCTHRVVNPGPEPAVLVEAGAPGGDGGDGDGDGGGGDGAAGPAAACGCPDASGYTVAKPWGDEIWFTANLDGPPYALKRIRMTAGHQSSLQSHRYKRETNYVVEGEATVLGGVYAPDDPAAVVDVAALAVTVHRPGSGWTNPPGELHRVIARSDYTSVEVSTPELDDVVRWQDDTGRGDGRIAAEHAGGRA